MRQIPFEALVKKALEFNQKGIAWHFHMIGPACIFSRLKSNYEIILEMEETGDIFKSKFRKKPIKETHQMAKLAYGSDFLETDNRSENEDFSGERVDENGTFLEMVDRARACCELGSAWHNHHLTPQCIFNPEKGKHCIVFEDEKQDDALYAYYNSDPVEDLAKLEKLFFKE